MAQAAHEDTPEIAMTRAWRMGNNARVTVERIRDALTSMISHDNLDADGAGQCIDMLALLLDESRFAAAVAGGQGGVHAAA